MQKAGETLEKMNRLLVEVQLELVELQKNLQEETPESSSPGPLAGEADLFPGPPQALKLVVPVFPPRIQVHGLRYPKDRPQPTTYQQVREAWFTAIRETLLYAGEEKLVHRLKTFALAVIWVRFYFPDRRVRDVDNYSLKFINDALVACRVLQDDDHRRLRLVVEGAVDKERPRTEILVIEDTGWLDRVRPQLEERV